MFRAGEDVDKRASTKVFGILELFEDILVRVRIKDLLLAQRVSKQWQAAITGSDFLSRTLYFSPIRRNYCDTCSYNTMDEGTFNGKIQDEISDLIFEIRGLIFWDSFYLRAFDFYDKMKSSTKPCLNPFLALIFDCYSVIAVVIVAFSHLVFGVCCHCGIFDGTQTRWRPFCKRAHQ